MNREVIRKTLNERPNKAVIFHLANGEKQVIRHPEFLVTKFYVVAADDNGLPVLMRPEAITAIHYAPNLSARRARGRKGTTSRR